MGFRKKQILGFGIIFVFLLIITVVDLISMNRMKKNMSEIVQDRYVKVKNANEIQWLFTSSDKGIIDSLNNDSAANIKENRNTIDNNAKEIQATINQLTKMVNKNEAGNILLEIQSKFDSYTATEQTIFEKLSNKEPISNSLLTEYKQESTSLTDNIKRFKSFQEKQMGQAMENADHLEQSMLQLLFISFVIVLLLLVVIGYWIISSTAKSLNQISKVMSNIDYDELGSLPHVEVKTEDEIGRIGTAFNQMVDSLEQSRQKEEEYFKQISEQNWMQKRIAEMATMYQNITHIDHLAERFIQKITPMMGASMGAFYLKEGKKDKIEFNKVATFAEDQSNPGRERFLLGEGLIGQAALEKRVELIEKIPENYSFITSGFSKIKPRHILITPVIYEDTVLAVLELASMDQFTPLELKFIEQINHTLGIAINSVLSRMEVERLLKESQMMTEELQTQSEELQTQSEELQSQSEELQSQSEELRMINEQLEERTKEAEKKSRDLEKTKEELEEKAEQLLQSSQYKSEFLANMSHELRTPLNSILLLSEMLSEDTTGGNLTEEQKEFARVIHSSGSDLLSLINDILDLTKVEAGKMEIVVDEMNVHELPVYVGGHFAYLAEQKGIELNVEVDQAALPKICFTDEQRMKQIIKNLLSNAIKFTEKGSVTFKLDKADEKAVEQYVRTEGVDYWLEVQVSDTGIGIPKKKQEIIFEAFQQGDGATGRKYGGTGLGLSICRQFARLLGGWIKLDSELGKGSTFTLYVPSLPNGLIASEEMFTSQQDDEIAITLEQLEECNDELEFIEEDTFRQKTAIICDDDYRNIFALKNALSKEGMNILTAQNGMECIELLNQHKEVDIVLMDIMMPEMDGYETMRQIRMKDEFNDLPIIALTAKAMKGDRQKCLEAGATDYISKPLKMGQLLSVMRVWLTKK
ncbi:response regulator [Heyndrickxia ginsengihumi]|uniref:Circadian input-output histidine kinase CikA n=1 Tax=Heyndrickxia ginsengihumi TaxID=363870 RepID=A0A6M0P8F4_9BACI|nr:response regulator [Heyndrickxia ginsengihumi]MBE6185041.1 response regulator [Bacillus sp. (in: firmicutes)]MCM3022062.1 ATP-binding protein [Heyndrickxia ginsengihumi]NEY20982.1 response regulator [Heyndrickxia ginsengihumi]